MIAKPSPTVKPIWKPCFGERIFEAKNQIAAALQISSPTGADRRWRNYWRVHRLPLEFEGMQLHRDRAMRRGVRRLWQGWRLPG